MSLIDSADETTGNHSTTLIPISQPGCIYATNPGYPDTTFSGRILALSETEIVDIPQVFIPFATDAKGQALYDKMVEGSFGED